MWCGSKNIKTKCLRAQTHVHLETSSCTTQHWRHLMKFSEKSQSGDRLPHLSPSVQCFSPWALTRVMWKKPSFQTSTLPHLEMCTKEQMWAELRSDYKFHFRCLQSKIPFQKIFSFYHLGWLYSISHWVSHTISFECPHLHLFLYKRFDLEIKYNSRRFIVLTHFLRMLLSDGMVRSGPGMGRLLVLKCQGFKTTKKIMSNHF